MAPGADQKPPLGRLGRWEQQARWAAGTEAAGGHRGRASGRTPPDSAPGEAARVAESRSFRGRLYEQGPSPMDGLGTIGKSNNRGSKSRHLSCGSPFMSGDVISGQDPPPGARGKTEVRRVCAVLARHGKHLRCRSCRRGCVLVFSVNEKGGGQGKAAGVLFGRPSVCAKGACLTKVMCPFGS